MISDRLFSFVRLLRENEIRVSAQEVGDAFAALSFPEVEGFASKDALRRVLLTTLAKKEEDAETLSHLFELHFGTTSGARSMAGLEDALVARGLDDDEAKAIAEQLRDERYDEDDDALDALARAILEGDTWALERALADSARAVDLTRMQTELQIGYFSQQILARVGADSVESALRSAADGIGSAAGEGGAMLLRGLVDERMLSFRRQARQVTTQEQRKRNFARERILKADLGIDRAFARLLAADLAALRPEVERLAQRLLTKTKTRERKARRGRIDLGKTLRANIAHDSIPIDRRFKRRRRERPELLMLCDISDSVRAASLFMLELVYAIGELFRRVRSFVFVDEVAEATDLFQTHSVDDAIASILGGSLIPAYASSDYGAALSSFAATDLEGLTQKTTVVILGDGRCNQRPPETWVVEEMRRRAKSVLWFCPEERRTWGLGDSEMPAFERACTQVHVVRNLRQLGAAVDCVGL